MRTRLLAVLVLVTSMALAQQRLAWYPIIGSSPETSLILGAGGYYTLKKADSATRTSFLNGNAMGTLRKQWMVGLSSNYFTKGEKYYIDADISYVGFPLYFYGIGNEVSRVEREIYHSNTFRFQFLAYRSLVKKLFLGVGYRAGNVHRMEYKEGGILETLQPLGVNGHYYSGLQAALLFDSRDNQLGASRGWYLRISRSLFHPSLGSRYHFSGQSIDLRKYFKPFKKREDVLALQAFAQGTTGDVPFTELALLGSGNLMRGYYSGQYRDRYYWATQAEYRYKLNSWLGFAGFVGMGSVAASADGFRADEVKPNYGVGARIAIMPSGNLTLRIDYGRGNESGNLYIAIMEAF
ncbi:MAG: BamA/TamA family outer membrane protein [Bacteroidota bacterium]